MSLPSHADVIVRNHRPGPELVAIGEPIPANSVGIVVQSKDPGVPVGTQVATYTGWQAYPTTTISTTSAKCGQATPCWSAPPPARWAGWRSRSTCSGPRARASTCSSTTSAAASSPSRCPCSNTTATSYCAGRSAVTPAQTIPTRVPTSAMQCPNGSPCGGSLSATSTRSGCCRSAQSWRCYCGQSRCGW